MSISCNINRKQVQMPKTIDVYVLEHKIGSGQFGDVFKGYSKVNGMEVAIKTIQRNKIKGKFNDLLESEIKVLQSCRNNNIIRLIDLKKTLNNIYLILEYCNEGDLNAYLKNKKRLPQQQAVQYFVQILHAFQTLVKNKIMHRDFKLANVLRHDGVIKVADFGFAKLLKNQDDHAQTILGSPLNMAPQIMDYQAYNSKADIWSIGVAFYQLLFSKVPFTAMNILQLSKKIKKEPVTFPFKTHAYIQDVLKRMLTVDPVKRIDWNELFTHPVTFLLQQHIEQQLHQSMLCQQQEIPFNLSKFYLKTNKVVEHVNDIMVRKELNSYIKTAIENKQTTTYQGAIIKRTTQRINQEKKKSKGQINREEGKNESTKEHTLEDQTINEPDTFTNFRTQKQLIQEEEAVTNNEVEQGIKNNFAIMLHYRNLYAFQGHLAEDLIELKLNNYAECLAFLMLKKAMTSLCNLKLHLDKRTLTGIKHWELLVQKPEYSEIYSFLLSEEEVFHRFNQKLSMRVLQAGILQEFEQDMMISGRFSQEETNQRIFQRIMNSYVKKISAQKSIIVMTHLIKLFQCSKIQRKQIGFDFSSYYQWFTMAEKTEIIQKYQKLLKKQTKVTDIKSN